MRSLIIVMLLLAACAKPEASAVLVSIEGNVTVDGRAAIANMSLSPGVTIVTGPEAGAEVEFYDASITRLDGNTTLTIGTVSRDKVSLSQLAGRTWTKLLRLSGIKEYTIQTPHATTVVRGTAFSVEVEEDKATVKVAEGNVTVEAGGEQETISEGQQAEIAEPAPAAYGEAVSAFSITAIEPDSWTSENIAQDEVWVDETVEEYYGEHADEYADSEEAFNLTPEESQEWIAAYAEGDVSTPEPASEDEVSEVITAEQNAQGTPPASDAEATTTDTDVQPEDAGNEIVAADASVPQNDSDHGGIGDTIHSPVNAEPQETPAPTPDATEEIK